MSISPSAGGSFIDRIRLRLEAWGYRWLDVPLLCDAGIFAACTAGTENRMFTLGQLALLPEVTNFVRGADEKRIGASKVYYVTRCLRDESTTDAERLREFTQVGVEILGVNPIDCRKTVRRDAIRLFRDLLGEAGWKLEDGVPRGLNLYADPNLPFEIYAESTRRQLLGGGAYTEGAGWALGLERLILAAGQERQA